MSTESDALPVGDVVGRKAGGEGALSIWDAARSLADTRYKEQAQAGREAEQQEKSAVDKAPTFVEGQGAVEQPKELAEEASAAPPEAEAPSETQEAEPAAEEAPPIDPPRSWTKDEKERFRSLPRETQEYLANREQERDREIRRSQNEAAEKSKSLTAKEQAAEQVRTQYEQALPLLLQAVQEAHQGEFADIKTVEDVTRLAREDWPRYVLWDAQQKKIAAVQQQLQAAQERQTQEKASKWSSYANEEDAKFFEHAPELKDREIMTKATQGAVNLLKDLGFSDEDLGAMWHGQKDVSLRDHRIQLLIRDGVKYREAQAAAKKVAAVPKPPVQRPGAAPQKGDSMMAQMQQLEKQIANTRGMEQMRLAARLRTMRLQAASR